MLHALNGIAISASKGTEATLRATKYLLNYAASNPNTTILYQKLDMILHSYSDAAYLVAPQARSCAGGYHFLTTADGTLFNAPIFVLAKVIKRVMSEAVMCFQSVSSSSVERRWRRKLRTLSRAVWSSGLVMGGFI